MENITIKDIVTSTLDKIEIALSSKQDGLYPYMNWIRQLAVCQRGSCGLFACGTLDGAAIGGRLLAQESGVNFFSIKTGMMNIENFNNLEAADKVLLLHQKNLLICAKKSSGAGGDIRLQFNPKSLVYFYGK